MSIGMDFSFPFAQHLYGIPEHATKLSLPTTQASSWGEPGIYGEPYRLYTLDVFEYELDEPMALYGAIPVLLGHGAEGTIGTFFFNPSETFIDIRRGSRSDPSAGGLGSHWISESGIIDLFIMPGPNP